MDGFAATRLTLGQQGLVRIGERVWTLSPGRPWTAAEAERGAGYDTDRQVAAVALALAEANAPEDRGLDFIDGARARHCRIPIDGVTLRRILPQVELLVGATDITRWRGDLDYWVFADGQLGQVDGRVRRTSRRARRRRPAGRGAVPHAGVRPRPAHHGRAADPMTRRDLS